jgi:hypothetical protein
MTGLIQIAQRFPDDATCQIILKYTKIILATSVCYAVGRIFLLSRGYAIYATPQLELILFKSWDGI